MSTKNPADVLALLERRLVKVWSRAAAGAPFPWEDRVTLGSLTSTELARNLHQHATWARTWTAWASERSVALEVRTQRVAGTTQQLPYAVTIPFTDAVRLVGEPWPTRLERGRHRAAALTDRLPAACNPDLCARAVRETDTWTALDFELLLTSADWFSRNDATGKTPRQVHIEGLHAKWLNTSQSLVAALAGRDSLNLAPPHPSVIHFTYLDPDYLESGRRRHDSHTVGDAHALAYTPSVILICENKDSVVTFPRVPAGIAVEGNGAGAGAFAATPWIRDAACVVYWGDMDADGLQILGQFRAQGIVHHSMLMNVETYNRYQRWGTNHDKNGRPLTAREPRQGLALEPVELTLYETLLAAEHPGPRRIEQERIPEDIAHAALLKLAASAAV
ncbi:Wadjet anti-phage system protein JetD domain-containing protein [Cellulosimicrobium cellulans]|nr:Wadjet anti-phage system protein JetD domain-containing protein [Cellulosimicrobium cellulans]